MEVNYQGLSAQIFFDSNTHSFWGEVLNSNDLITVQASSFNEAAELLYQTIDRYLLYIAALKAEDRPAS